MRKFSCPEINYAHILDKFKKGLILVNEDGLIIDANDFAFNILDDPLIISKSLLEYVSNYDVWPFAKRMQQLLSNNESEIDILLNLENKNGESNAVQLFATLADEPNKNIIILIEGIEEAKKCSNELKATKYELEMFAYRASHDLQGPVATIKGLCNLSSMGPIGEKNGSIKIIDLITTECDKLGKSIAKFSIVSTLKEDYSLSEAIDFDQIIKNVISDLKFNDAFNIQVENKIRSSFHSSPTYIKTIFYHLLENTKCFRKRNSSAHDVLINLYEEEYYGIYIKVKDLGLGIETSQLPMVFDIFHRGVSPYSGSGIGLYLVKNIVEKLKGKIKIDSKLNQFTNISVFLPFNY